MDSPTSTATTVVLTKINEDSESSERPEDEWSSLETHVNLVNMKDTLYKKGLYSPGSGEICANYLSISASSVFRHLYFNYPAVLDPGITDALLSPEVPHKYPDDGQELYLDLCKEMRQVPVRQFYKGLLLEKINLKYYGVNPHGVRAMALALEKNMTVKVLDLTDNFLNIDACYHLGRIMISNRTLEELNLSGCKIGPVGLKQLLSGLKKNTNLVTLNINRNELGDDGITHLANAIFHGLNVEELYLSKNYIGSTGANLLADALQSSNNFSVIDLSYNNFTTPAGLYNLLTQLSENESLQKLDLSWNSLYHVKIAAGLSSTMKAPQLRYLNLDHNRFSTEAVASLLTNLAKAKKLDTLILSNNPLTLDDAFAVLSKLKYPRVKVKNLQMKNILVDQRFMELLNHIKRLKSRRDAVITHGDVIGTYIATGPDIRDVVLNRMDFLLHKRKKPVDFALFCQNLIKQGKSVLPLPDFVDELAKTGAVLDDNLMMELSSAFPYGKKLKVGRVDVNDLVDAMLRKWPDRKLPETPPETPAPEPTEPAPTTPAPTTPAPIKRPKK